MVKEWINEYGGTLKFPITKELLKLVKEARSKYMALLEEKKILEQREKQKVQEKEDVLRIEAEKQSSEFFAK